MVETAETVTSTEKSTTESPRPQHTWGKLRDEIQDLYKAPERRGGTTDGAPPMALGTAPEPTKSLVPDGGVAPDGSLTFASSNEDSQGKVGEQDKADRPLVEQLKNFGEWAGDFFNRDKSSVTRDEAGHVTEVTYPQGKSRQFGYDESGQLNKVTQPDGTVFNKEGDKWVQGKSKAGGSLGSDSGGAAEAGAAAGKEKEDSKGIGAAVGGLGALMRGKEIINPQVAEDGTFTYSTQDGRNYTYKPNGTGTIKNENDGSQVSVNENNKPTAVAYNNGQTREMGYDSDGNLNKVTDTNGQSYRFKDGHWQDKDGNPAENTNFKVDNKGRFTYENRDGQTVTVKTDRTSDVKNPNGSDQKQDENGRITEVKDNKGQTTRYEYDNSGQLAAIRDAEGKEIKRGEDGKWSDGRTDVRLDKDGTLTYVDTDNKVVLATTDGNTRTSDKTVDELNKSAEELHGLLDHPWLLEKLNGPEVNDLIRDMSPTDRYLLQQQYEKQFGRKLINDVDRLVEADAGSAQKMLYSANLQEHAIRNISDQPGSDGKNQRQAFLDNMNEFVIRADRDKLSDKEVANTLGQTQRLFETNNSKVSGEQRLMLAQQVMLHSAHPDLIDQGGHLTCNVTDVEMLTFTRRPSAAASMIADVALSGEWTAPDGKKITIPPQNLVPDAEARVNPPDDGRRSFASQIFQTTALNDIGQRWDPPKHFTNRPPESSADQGEYWTDANGKPLLNDKGESDKFGGLGFVDIAESVQRMTGQKDVVLMNSGNDYPEVKEFQSEADLRKLITDAQKDGKMPLIIGVSSDDQLLGGGDKPGTEGRDSNNHVVVIRDYNPSTGMVRVDNSWGKDDDKWVTLSELYTATR